MSLHSLQHLNCISNRNGTATPHQCYLVELLPKPSLAKKLKESKEIFYDLNYGIFFEGQFTDNNQVQTYIRTQMMPRFPIPASESKSMGFCRSGSRSMYSKSSLIAGKLAYLNIRVISACPANTSTKLNLVLSWKSLPETTVSGRE